MDINNLEEIDAFENLAKIAYKQEELSDFAPLPTKYMYVRLSILYDSFAKGKYTKEQCIALKNKLKVEYKQIMQEHERDMECYREYLANRRENETMLTQLEKTDNVNQKLDICLKIIANCVHDKNLYDRNRVKGEQLDF